MPFQGLPLVVSPSVEWAAGSLTRALQLAEQERAGEAEGFPQRSDESACHKQGSDESTEQRKLHTAQ